MVNISGKRNWYPSNRRHINFDKVSLKFQFHWWRKPEYLEKPLTYGGSRVGRGGDNYMANGESRDIQGVHIKSIPILLFILSHNY